MPLPPPRHFNQSSPPFITLSIAVPLKTLPAVLKRALLLKNNVLRVTAAAQESCWFPAGCQRLPLPGLYGGEMHPLTDLLGSGGKGPKTLGIA